MAFVVGACSPATGDEDDAEGPDFSSPRPWESETETGVAASGSLAISVSTGVFEAEAHTSSFFRSLNLYRMAGIRTEEDLWITVEVAADAMVAGATVDCGPGGDAEVIVSMDLDSSTTRGVFSSHDGTACSVTIEEFNGVGGIVSGTFSAILVDADKALDLYVYLGTFDTTRGSSR